MEYIIGALVAFGVFLIGQWTLHYTKAFKSNLRVLIDQPPDLQILNSTNTSSGTILHLLKIIVRVKNKGLKPGYVTKAEIKPSGMTFVPDIELLSLDRRDIGSFKTRELEVVFRLEFTAGSIKQSTNFKIGLCDDNGQYFGALEIEGWPGDRSQSVRST